MELTAVPLTTLLVAIAGPVGVTLGWWLARRSEHQREAREERKSAYVEFIKAAVVYRNADAKDRPALRNDRWAALATLILVAPPKVFEEAWQLVGLGEKLLDHAEDDPELLPVYREMWERFSTFSRLARSDLGIKADPFSGRTPVPVDDPPRTESAADTDAAETARRA